MQKLRKLCQVSHTMNVAQERLAIVLPAVSGEAQFRTEDTDGRGLIVGASEMVVRETGNTNASGLLA